MRVPRPPIRLLVRDGGNIAASDRFAGEWIWANHSFGLMQRFAEANGEDVVCAPAISTPCAFERQTTGSLAGHVRSVRLRGSDDRYDCEIAGVCTLRVDVQQDSIESDLAVDSPWLPEVMLGPGLILALASRGVFALHAAAVEWRGGVWLLLGASGTGKSTFGAIAGRHGARRWTDDISPIVATPIPTLRPRFPQLKWAQPVSVPDVARPIAGIVELTRAGPSLALHRLDALEASVVLIAHTVAARLFPPTVTAMHLAAVSKIASTCPVFRMAWPTCHADALQQQVGDAMTLMEDATPGSMSDGRGQRQDAVP